jgi:c-di-GMP-binding flagellar brake protein YcgR
MEAVLNTTQRRTDRVSIELQILVFGSDVVGQSFQAEARTVEVSAHGALIVVKQKLTPQDEIIIQRSTTRKEAVARVLGQIRQEPDGGAYGVNFIDPEINLWDIQFVPLSESQSALGRTLLECAKCQLREVVCLEEYEFDVFAANEFIFHSCKRCRETTIWRQTLHEPVERDPVRPRTSLASPTSPSPPPPLPPRTQNDRKYVRVKSKLKACIQFPGYTEEVLEIVDFSRGGIRFASRKDLPKGMKIKVAIPYAPGAGNIFVAAEIVRTGAISSEGLHDYGAAYIKN